MQRYQEDHADEMEIIKLHKKYNKKDRKVLQPKALSKSDEPKKAIDDPSDEEQKPKKASNETTTKAEKKVKKTLQSRKAPKSPEFVDTDTDDEQGTAVKCIVTYSTEDEQEPTIKKSSDGQGLP